MGVGLQGLARATRGVAAPNCGKGAVVLTWPALAPAREAATSVSTLDDHDLQILAGYDKRRLSGDVEPFQQTDDVLLQRGLLGRVQRSERLERRSIEIAENLDPVCARAIAKIEQLAHA